MSFLENLWKMLKKHRDIKLVSTERRRNNLVSEPNYHTTKFFTEHYLAIEMKKPEILMNKLVYLRLSILELSKIPMHKFWYHYVKLKYGEKAKFCYIDVSLYTQKQIIFIKALQKILKLDLILQIMS